MEAVIFIGIQASGKSTFFKTNFFDTHVRINLDMLKTRHRENSLFQACLEMKQPFVIDNTNPTQADRQRYITLAQNAGFQVNGYYFQSKLQESIERNQTRTSHKQIPDVGIRATYNKLELPIIQEGFDNLYYVSIEPDGLFKVEAWQDEI